MKTTLVSILIACLPVALWAQSKPTYQPGKWYIGVRAEAYTIQRGTRSQGIDSESQGIGLLAGRRLSPHFDLQLGLMAASQPSDYTTGLIEKDAITDRGYIGRTLYAPLTVKYIPFGSRRRWQPYLTTGLTTVIGKVRLEEQYYDFTMKSVTETGQLSVNLLFGLGVQVRTVSRLHTFLDLYLMGPVYQGGGGASINAGLIYDLRSR